jgi:serine/threonine protein kinase
MSPEQAQGRTAGPAADLYALGVVLFELLTRRTPFAGRTFTGQLLAKVTERAPALREVRPDLERPCGVHELVAQLLERDPAARPPSARAVAERMTGLLEGASLPPLVRAVDTVPAAARSRQRSKSVATRECMVNEGARPRTEMGEL